MVFTLHRYIFREVFKVFILAAIALTLIMSLGSILRPVQEYGVGPQQVVHLMGYFLPITLTFVLPMAALFAAALVYGRLASDNELDACRASGISLITLVYPGLALAIMVAIANLLLSFYVMPAFVHRAQKSLKADAQQIIFRNIQRKGYYKLPPDGRYLIYADQANLQNETLAGVIVIETKHEAIEKIVTAEKAKVHFNTHKRFNEVQIIAHNTYQMGPEDERGFYAESLSLTKDFPSLLADDIKFKKIDEMKKIRTDLMRFDPIAKLARQTYAQFLTELLTQDISKTIADKNNRFYKVHSSECFIEFTADSCTTQDEKQIELLGEITVIEYDITNKQTLRTMHSARALLHIEGDELAPTLTMELYNPKWLLQNGTERIATRQIIRGLIIPQKLTDKFATKNILKTISPAATTLVLKQEQCPKLTNLQSRLRRKIWKTQVSIKAEMHSRLVFGIGCISLIMIGIGLGIIEKGGHLLSAFGASSVPAAALIVFIMMGKNITKNPDSQAASGILLMWAGLILLSLLAVMIYRKLLKN